MSKPKKEQCQVIMDIIEKMREPKDFTSSEQEIINLILNKPDTLMSSTTAAQLGASAYTSASTVVRLCKKLGCESFSDFKTRFISQYTQREHSKLFVDASLPFKASDDIGTIFNQLTELEEIALRQTLSLVQFDVYEKVIRILHGSSCIDIFGAGADINLLHDFAYKMASIHRQVHINPDHQQQILAAGAGYKDHCAILVSYSGETKHTLRCAELLRSNCIKTISVTNNGANSLTALTDYHLYIASLESRSYKNAKIGAFTSCISIMTIMNYLYAGVFRIDYERNYNYLISDSTVFTGDRIK
jgi:DNA-binding MurR/RpiR family transcriptional regulator